MWGIGFRFLHLDKVPYGIYVDETSIGENAYLINKYGVDEWGKQWPVYFKAFGEYKNPLFIYSTAWLFSFFNPSVWLLRFSTSIWGLAAIGATAWAVYELVRSKWLAYLSSVMITLMPWHIHASRVVFEAITFPVFMALSVACVVRFIRHKSTIWVIISTLIIGFSFYSYTAARLYSPLFILALVGLATILKNWKYGLLVILVAFITWIPAINSEIENPGSLMARYQVVAGSEVSWTRALEVITTYLHQFDYRLWFTTGDGNLRHTPLRGLLPYSLITPFALGLFLLVRNWRSTQSLILIFLFLTAPFAAALTHTDPIALRMIHLIPILIIISMIGIKYIFEIFQQKKIILVAFVGIMFVEFLHFSQFYIHDFPAKAYIWFDGSFYDAYPKIRTYSSPIIIHTSVHEVTSKYLDKVYGFDQLARIHHNWTNRFEYKSSFYNVYFGNYCKYNVGGNIPLMLTKDSCILSPGLIQQKL